MRFKRVSEYAEKTNICGYVVLYKIRMHYANWENICANVDIRNTLAHIHMKPNATAYAESAWPTLVFKQMQDEVKHIDEAD